MRAFLMDGALADGDGPGGTAVVEQFLRQALTEHDFEVEAVSLRDLSIAYCRGCFECWTRTPGVCRTDDDARAVTRRFIRSDLVAFLTPVTFGGYSSELKKALDRSIGILSPFFLRIDGETHHRRRYARYPSLLGVGVLTEPVPEDEAVFRALVRRNAINMHAPAHAAAVFYRTDDSDVVRLRMDALVESVMVPA